MCTDMCTDMCTYINDKGPIFVPEPTVILKKRGDKFPAANDASSFGVPKTFHTKDDIS